MYLSAIGYGMFYSFQHPQSLYKAGQSTESELQMFFHIFSGNSGNSLVLGHPGKSSGLSVPEYVDGYRMRYCSLACNKFHFG